MSNILNKQLVLSLNQAWQPIGQLTVRAAITAMTGGEPLPHGRFTPPALALDLEVRNGETVMARPTPWDEWIMLPVREDDLAIHASRNRCIRVPTVVIRPNYAGMPLRSRKLCFEGVWERDRGVCQYTNKKLEKHEANLDHVIPVSQGGKRQWVNLVVTSKGLNNRKGGKRPEEVGLKLLRHPMAPTPVPASVIVSRTCRELLARGDGDPSWAPFLLDVGHR